MSVKKYKPVTSTQRFKSVIHYGDLSHERPKKSLVKKLNYHAGRSSSSGRIAVRRKGGQHKRLYRIIDFKRNKLNVPGEVFRLEYDPNRTVNIALIKYRDGEYRYILAPNGIKKGQEVVSGTGAPIKIGNALPLGEIPAGTQVHNIELNPGRGGQIARSAGSLATIAGHDGELVSLKLPSGEVRKIQKTCMATIGILSNRDHNLISLGKAGRSRWMGRRPSVRGVAMNPVDHPHGGGEGKSSGGRHPVTPWGKPTRGYKTRNLHKRSDRFIVQKRVNKRISR